MGSEIRANNEDIKKIRSSRKVSVEARANIVRSDIKKHSNDLDARNSGSIFVRKRASGNTLS